MLSKTIILSNPNANQSRAILTMYLEDDLLKSKIRLYNHPKLPTSTKLGIYHNNLVYSANLLEKSGIYISSFVGDFDLNLDFYCALIDTDRENEVLLSGGTYSGYFFNNDEVFSSTNQDNEEVHQTIDTDCTTDCSRCKYKDYFFASHEEEKSPTPTTEIEKKEANEPLKTTNLEIKSYFQSIFNNYPMEEELSSLITDSHFVKIGNDNDSYYLGTIGEDSNISYICYAKKSNYNSPVPEELGEHYQWIPINPSDPLSDGYYVVYQDSKDLKIIDI